MKETIKYLKAELSGITVESQKITFVTDFFLPFEFTIFFRYVIKNKLGEIVAVGTSFKDDGKLDKFLLKVKAGFSYNIFYQTSDDQLWLLKPKSSEEKIDKKNLAQELKRIDPSLKTENEILIETLRDSLETKEKELKKIKGERQELIDSLEWKQIDYRKEIEKRDVIIQRFQTFEKERISYELDKLENKSKFIQQAVDVFNPAPDNEWVDSYYGKNASDKVQTFKWTKNSKINRSVNFLYQKWFLKVDLLDWDSEQRRDVISESIYFEYSDKLKQFIPQELDQKIPFWLILELGS